MTVRPARTAFWLSLAAAVAALICSTAPALADGSWSVAPETLDFGTVTAGLLGSGKVLTFTINNHDPKYYVLVDTIERDAWYDYFAADVDARAYFPVWQVVTDDYWDEFDTYQQLLAKKQKLIQGYDPASGMRVVVDSKFSDSVALKVVLAVEQGERPVTLHVALSDRQATPVGSYKYTAAANGRPAGVTVEVR